MASRRTWYRLAAAVSCGILLGVSLFTLQYAEGLAYLGTESAACANCHIMQPQYASWQRASHHHVAGCVDCHLPHQGLDKWLSKAENGYRHSVAFTSQNFREPIEMTAGNRRTLQENCVRCHADLVDALTATPREPVRCVHCHQTVGHGPRAALGGPLGTAYRERRIYE